MALWTVCEGMADAASNDQHHIYLFISICVWEMYLKSCPNFSWAAAPTILQIILFDLSDVRISLTNVKTN